MSRYYFNVYDGVADMDHSGSDLTNVITAQCEAAKYAGRYLIDHAKDVVFGEPWALEVTDAKGLVLFRIDLVMSKAPALFGPDD